MRKLLLLYILVLLWVLPAKSTLSFALFPQDKLYVLSLAQKGPTSAWDGQITFAGLDALNIALPSRFKMRMHDVSLSMGYAGFWQEYALLPLFARQQAYLFQTKKNAILLLVEEKKVIGYEHVMERGNLSALAWIQQREETTSFQTEWGSHHSGWGVAGKISLESSFLDLRAELLFTPVRGIGLFVSSLCKYGSSKLSFAYGQSPYPSRYSLSLTVQSSIVRATFVMEDWFGSKPIYGGFSAMRRRRQSGALKFSLGEEYLLFSFSDTYEFKPRGSQVGTVMMQMTWGGPFGQVSAQYGENRGGTRGDGQYKLSLVLYKATLSYTAEGYEITLADSVAMGKGIGTWKLKKSMGKGISLSVMYGITSDL